MEHRILPMQSLQFSEEERRETLRRAQEIADNPPARSETGELESYLRAAEETGIPRDAVLAALRERLLVPADSLKEGDLVFAPSADGASYPARIDRFQGDEVVVTFMSGGEHTLALASIRPLGLVPGRQLQ